LTAKIAQSPITSTFYVPSTRQNLAQTKIFPVFFPVICKPGEKSSTETPTSTNSRLQFAAEVEVSGLQTETDGRVREISLILKPPRRMGRPKALEIAPEWGDFGMRF
jgi:hypothetical protein